RISAGRIEHMSGNLAVLEPGDAVAGGLRKPDRAIRRNRQPAEANDRCSEWKAGNLARRGDARDPPSTVVGVPDIAVGPDAQPDRLDIVARQRKLLELSVAYAADGRGEIDREPDGAVGRGGNRRGHVQRLRHP